MLTVNDPLTCSGFNVAGLPPDEARQIWRGAVRTHQLMHYDPAPQGRQADWADAWLLDRIIISPCQIASMRVQRTAALIAADGTDHYSIAILNAGSWTGRHGPMSVHCRAGSAFVIDMGQPLDLLMLDSRAIQVIIPRNMLAAEVTGYALHGRMLRGAAGEVFIDTVLAITERLPRFVAADAAPLTKVICELAEAALRLEEAVGRDEAQQANLREQVRHIVRLRLSEPDLSPASLARTLGVSRTKLYAVMEPSGGVAAFIREQRLRAAHALLLKRRNGGHIKQVAAAVGIPNQAHFSRAFRIYFGVSPRDLVTGSDSHAVMESRPLTDERPWSTWIRQLGR